MTKSTGKGASPKKSIQKAPTVAPMPPSGNDAANSFVISLSLRFLFGAMISVSTVAFAAGRFSAMYFLLKHGIKTAGFGALTNARGGQALLLPVYLERKQIPHTVYSSKHYDSGALSKSDTLLARRASFGEGFVFQEISQDGNVSPAYNVEVVDQLHEPSGQHLLVDIKSVDGVFLNSEERLAAAMIDLVELSGLTMLSYHCHQLHPVGVSCVGVLLESHISFHTWPIPGAVSLDLFTCGPNSLMPILPEIERLFGVPRNPAVHGGVVEKPFMQWAHKRRGFRLETGNPKDIDLSQFVLGWMEFDMKQMVVSVETEFQTVEIYDVINPRFSSLETYKHSLSSDGSYEALHPELFRPDRVVYLDGIMQSRLYGEAAYHEALVHPAMITHSNPKRVAIIGGGEGATLREVLKHRTVEIVTMIVIDEIMVNVSREHLPEWSDCSMMIGSAPSCFDDPRSQVYYADAIAWFIKRFSDKDKVDASQLFDVIIIDALDPSSAVELSEVFYDNVDFVRSLTNALGDDGILVAQVGEHERSFHAGAQYTSKLAEFAFTEHLEEQGFQIIVDYGEAHGRFMSVWKYKIAMKSRASFKRWNYGQAMFDLVLHGRLMETIDGAESLFRFFDGATMMTYQYPSRVNEEIYCRGTPMPELCEMGHGWDPEHNNAHISFFEIKPSLIPSAGRGIFAKVDIPAWSYLAADESCHDLLIMPSTAYWIEQFGKAGIVNRWKMFDAYRYGYGFSSIYYGEPSISVDGSIMTFLNHGCNGSNNLSPPDTFFETEMTADPKNMPDVLKNCYFEMAVYSPFVQRNHLFFQTSGDFTGRDINAGEELLDTYLAYFTEDFWEKGILDLRAQCLAQGIGSVSSYEKSSH